MKRIMVLFMALFLAGFFSASAQTVSTRNLDMPYSVFIPCVPESASGTLNMHVVVHTNKSGMITKVHSQPMGGELIGAVTGLVYHPSGVTQTISNPFDGNAGNKTYVNVYHIVGQQGIQFRVKVLTHITINANGELTVDFTNAETICE